MKRLVGLRALVPFVLLAVAACGGGSGDADTTAMADTSTQAAATEAQAGSSATPPSDAPMVLTAQDVDLYRRGREAEIARVREHGQQYAQAKNASDSSEAMSALIDERGRQRAAAAAIGIDEQRYIRLLETVDAVLRRWQGAQMGASATKGVDTSTLTAEQRAQMRSMATPNFEGLPPQNVQLLLPQAPLLDSLRMMPALLAIAAVEGRS